MKSASPHPCCQLPAIPTGKQGFAILALVQTYQLLVVHWDITDTQQSSLREVHSSLSALVWNFWLCFQKMAATTLPSRCFSVMWPCHSPIRTYSLYLCLFDSDQDRQLLWPIEQSWTDVVPVLGGDSLASGFSLLLLGSSHLVPRTATLRSSMWRSSS